MQEKYRRLLEILAEVYDLMRVQAVLHWDEQCCMPPGGAEARAEQKATLQRLFHARATGDEVGELLDQLEPWARGLGDDTDESALIRVARRNYDLFRKLPPALVVEWSKAGSRGYHAWMEARKANDFAPFKPALEHLVGLLLQITDALGYEDRRYDALLDRSEPGLKTAQVEALFERLRQDLVPLVQAIAQRAGAVDDGMLHRQYEADRQWDLSLEALKAVGFDLERGRLDKSVHPFTTSFSPDDVRLTTRIRENHFNDCFFSVLHEGGHGLYAQGIPAAFRRTPLDGGASSGVHESQSRLWENVLGRSRGFWEYFYPRVQECFPAQTEGVSVEDWYRAVNRVQPSFIRVDADEVTYNLHIMLRFELENRVLEGDLAVADLPGAWNERMREYLGITPPDPLQGVLQDIHWSGGGFGGFPSYTLGNVISLQLYETLKIGQPDLEEGFRQGEFLPLLTWMRENVHIHGSKYKPMELLQKVTGRELDPEPYLTYIKTKFSDIYGL